MESCPKFLNPVSRIKPERGNTNTKPTVGTLADPLNVRLSMQTKFIVTNNKGQQFEIDVYPDCVIARNIDNGLAVGWRKEWPLLNRWRGICNYVLGFEIPSNIQEDRWAKNLLNIIDW